MKFKNIPPILVPAFKNSFRITLYAIVIVTSLTCENSGHETGALCSAPQVTPIMYMVHKYK